MKFSRAMFMPIKVRPYSAPVERSPAKEVLKIMRVIRKKARKQAAQEMRKEAK